MARLHALIGEHLGEDAVRGGRDRDRDRPRAVGSRTGRGGVCGVRGQPAAGLPVPGTPCCVRRQERPGDAHVLADMVRTDAHQLRTVAGDSAGAEAVKVVTRAQDAHLGAHPHGQRLRHALREYFPAALEAFEDLDAPDTLELLGKAPDPAGAARLTCAQVSAALKRAHRRDIPDRATAILAALRGDQLGQPPAVTAAYAATVRALTAVVTLNEQIAVMQEQVEAYFGQHPAAEINRPEPGLGSSSAPGCSPSSVTTLTGMSAARPARTTAVPAPITRASGQEEGRRRPVHPQRPAHRRADGPGPERPGLRLAPGPSTTPSAPAAPGRTLPCASSPADSSASCTDASKPAPSTTRQPPGPSGKRPLNLTSPLDT